MLELIIVRGPSGSGKSTYAAQHYPDYVNYEADDYFVQNGVYDWDATKLHIAHHRCMYRTKQSLAAGRSVVVSNTSTRMREVQPYLSMAAAQGAAITVVNMHTQYENQHGVTDEKVAEMRQRFAEIPSEIIIHYDIAVIDVK